MNNHRLRSVLLNLICRLSDRDRERLHFYLKNDVPRPLSDDSTFTGTLRLMQSLFDQEKISDQDFTLLIETFKELRCFDAVIRLREHQRQMHLSGHTQSIQSLGSMMPSMIEEWLDEHEEDRPPIEQFILEEINNNENVLRGSTVQVNPINVEEDRQNLLSERKQGFWRSSLIKKCLLLIFASLILVLVILIIIVSQTKSQVDSLKQNLRIQEVSDAEMHHLLDEKDQVIQHLSQIIMELNQQQNQSTNQFNTRLSERSLTIEQLNKTFIESKQERKTFLIKAGRKFGGDQGDNFDDSLLPNFTSGHYLSGILFSNLSRMESCQFIYRSSHDNESRIESPFHGGYGDRINSSYKYELDDDERIEQVSVKSSLLDFYNATNFPFTKKVIVGLQFITTKNRSVPPGFYLIGDDVEYERFPGYTLGYATGNDGLKIDQLQFFWYRTRK